MMPDRLLPDRSKGLWLALLATVLPIQAPAELSQEVLGSVVMIEVQGQGVPSFGTGVVLYSQENEITIATAAHVLYGRYGCSGEKTRFGANPTWKLSFYSNQPATIAAQASDQDVFRLKALRKDLDLALIRVRVDAGQDLPRGIELGSPDPQSVNPDLVAAEGSRGDVTAVGYASSTSNLANRMWIERSGPILDINPDRVVHSADIEVGFSGGPLFSEEGKLLGINTCFDTRPEVLAYAVPTDTLLRTFRGLINPLRMRGDVDDLAYEIYREGLRAVAHKDWARVRKLMAQARDRYGNEGGTIHLRGMRYTRYLPSYYLGLAEFRSDDCEGARQAWLNSTLDEGLGGRRRSARLRKMRRACRENH